LFLIEFFVCFVFSFINNDHDYICIVFKPQRTQRKKRGHRGFSKISVLSAVLCALCGLFTLISGCPARGMGDFVVKSVVTIGEN